MITFNPYSLRMRLSLTGLLVTLNVHLKIVHEDPKYSQGPKTQIVWLTPRLQSRELGLHADTVIRNFVFLDS
jgi:hypothetical protein